MPKTTDSILPRTWEIIRHCEPSMAGKNELKMHLDQVIVPKIIQLLPISVIEESA